MRCSICGMEIDSIDKAVKQGWIPYFYDGETEHEFVCPGCSEIFLCKDEEDRKENRVMGIIVRQWHG
jgi:uncharacterized protein with PIN domain